MVGGAAFPVCRAPISEVSVGLSSPSVPSGVGVTMATSVIVVTSPPGSVDVKIEVVEVGLGVVDVENVEAIEMLECAHINCLVG